MGRDERWVDATEPFDRTIMVPFPPESTASGIGDTDPHQVVWYRREVSLDSVDLNPDHRLMLHFGAVDYRADVWVNGIHVAFHEGGHTPFEADITHALEDGSGTATIVVRAEDLPEDIAQPRGKQDWQTPSHGIWYRRTTGIWQPVWLEVVGHYRIADVHWQPDSTSLTLGATTIVTPVPTANADLTLRVELSLNGETLVDDCFSISDRPHTTSWQLGKPGIPSSRSELVWSPANPNLVEAKLTLLGGEQVLDTVHSYAGLRSVMVEQNGLLLNGFPLYMRSVLEQGFWPESHIAAPSAEAIKREVELILDLGFNSARIHQKIEDPRFLAWCDRLGLIVWGEIANAFTFSDDALVRTTREWTDAVLRDRNHPSIVAWVPINESWSVPALPHDPRQRHWQEALWHLTHALDGSRPVISNDGWEHTTSDILSIHDYCADGDVLKAKYDEGGLERTLKTNRPNRRLLQLTPGTNDQAPVMITEYGGISYAPKSGERWYGYDTVTTEVDYIAKVKELTEAIRACPGVSGYCYTQFTDTEQETNGLLTENREPKLPIEAIREIFGAS